MVVLTIHNTQLVLGLMLSTAAVHMSRQSVIVLSAAATRMNYNVLLHLISVVVTLCHRKQSIVQILNGILSIERTVHYTKCICHVRVFHVVYVLIRSHVVEY